MVLVAILCFLDVRHYSVIIKNAIHGKGVNILASRKPNWVPYGSDRRMLVSIPLHSFGYYNTLQMFM